MPVGRCEGIWNEADDVTGWGWGEGIARGCPGAAFVATRAAETGEIVVILTGEAVSVIFR
jgi:hypothetical protein